MISVILWNAPPTAALWLTPIDDGSLRAPRTGKAASEPPQSIKEQTARKCMRYDTRFDLSDMSGQGGHQSLLTRAVILRLKAEESLFPRDPSLCLG